MARAKPYSRAWLCLCLGPIGEDGGGGDGDDGGYGDGDSDDDDEVRVLSRTYTEPVDGALRQCSS